MVSLCNIITALTFFLMPAPTVLYDSNSLPIVTLPTGYFVMQSDAAAPDGFIAVTYDDINGFVRISDVRQVDYSPVTKYETTVKFKCDNDGQKVNLRAAPSRSADVVTVLNSDASGRCYGPTDGDALISGGDTTWYYVSVDGMRGYCYYAHIDVDPTPPNIIEKEPDPLPPEQEKPAKQPTDEPQSRMSTVAAIIFIVALCIPVPFIMFFLFRKPKNRETE